MKVYRDHKKFSQFMKVKIISEAKYNVVEKISMDQNKRVTLG